MLTSAAVCFAGVFAWYVNCRSKDMWSQTPLVWMLILATTPVLCAIMGVALV